MTTKTQDALWGDLVTALENYANAEYGSLGHQTARGALAEAINAAR
jgi:hypothetical protein